MFLFYSEEQIMPKFIENWGGISFSMNVQKGCKMPTLQCGDNIIGLKTGKMLWTS